MWIYPSLEIRFNADIQERKAGSFKHSMFKYFQVTTYYTFGWFFILNFVHMMSDVDKGKIMYC